MRLAACIGLLFAGLTACGDPRPATPPGPDTSAWRACLRPSALPGVEVETAPHLTLEVEGVPVVTGSLGQRGPDVDPPESTVRLAAVGGALTFGVGLPAEEAWPHALAAQLNHSMLSGGKAVAALDLSVPFASARDVIGVALRRATSWRPWLMVLELDASTTGGATLEDLEAPLNELRAAAQAIECGVLVVVTQPFERTVAGDRSLAAEQQLLLRAADRAGLATLELDEDYRARPPAGALVAETRDQHVPHATADAQRWVLERVKQRLFHTGLLAEALGSR